MIMFLSFFLSFGVAFVTASADGIRYGGYGVCVCVCVSVRFVYVCDLLLIKQYIYIYIYTTYNIFWSSPVRSRSWSRILPRYVYVNQKISYHIDNIVSTSTSW